MSFNITTAFVEQYKNNVVLTAQQRGSRLRNTVMIDDDVVGKSIFVEQIGPTEAVDVTSRHGDSPLVSSDHRRRRITLVDREWGDLIDDVDKVRLLIEPTSPYAINAANAMGRKMDDVLKDAASDDADTGPAGTTATPLPAGQKVAVDYVESGGATDSDMTIGKLRRAKEILDENEVDEEDRHIAIASSQLQSLLRTTEVSSSDFNTVKALVNGEIGRYLGFDFHRTQRLTKSSDVRTIFAYQRSGLKLAIGKDVMTRIAERPDKRFSVYVYVAMTIGATRLEEEKVVEIKCNETK